jgi:hypothetical protein
MSIENKKKEVYQAINQPPNEEKRFWLCENCSLHTDMMRSRGRKQQPPCPDESDKRLGMTQSILV